jgi:hypothetical protein
MWFIRENCDNGQVRCGAWENNGMFELQTRPFLIEICVYVWSSEGYFCREIFVRYCGNFSSDKKNWSVRLFNVEPDIYVLDNILVVKNCSPSQTWSIRTFIINKDFSHSHPKKKSYLFCCLTTGHYTFIPSCCFHGAAPCGSCNCGSLEGGIISLPQIGNQWQKWKMARAWVEQASPAYISPYTLK